MRTSKKNFVAEYETEMRNKVSVKSVQRHSYANPEITLCKDAYDVEAF